MRAYGKKKTWGEAEENRHTRNKRKRTYRTRARKKAGIEIRESAKPLFDMLRKWFKRK